ncbi:MAG: GntR family transcriptional regulator [Sphaerochaetaceae bacterium]|nr:GntR family transcriptional regulator [Sphaerochaetaceae bacterium]
MFKHRVLYNSIQDKIISGAWYEGMLIPSESQLCEMYQVSRITVRRALKELEDQKLVYKIQGKGTFVRASINDVLEQQYSYGVDDSVVYEVLEAKKIPATSNLIIALKLPKGENEVFFIKRLRFRDNVPEAIVNTYYRVELGSKLIDKDIHHINSISLLSEIAGQPVVKVQTMLIPVNPTIEEARMLNLSITSAHSKIRRTSEFKDGDIAEYAEAFINSDDIAFSISSWNKRDSSLLENN